MAIPTDKRHETVAWLPRAKVGGKSGDFLIVVLSSAVFIMLGLAAMIVRFSPSDPANSKHLAVAVAAPQRNSAANPPSKPQPVAEKQIEIVRSQNETARNIASVGSNPPASSPVSKPPTVSTAPALPADALAPAAREPAIVAAAPIAAQPPGVAFAPDPPPFAPRVVNERAVEPPTRALPRKPEVEASPEASPEPARPQVAKAEAPPSEAALRKGGEGATWAAYFDSFPDQRAAAAQINALQSKYGPHLGGRRLTYARKGESWLMRASGLTQEAADEVCEKVRKAGSACSVGGR